MENQKVLKVKEIVKFLDQYVISQDEAKKQIAVALKNKLRRELLDDEWKNEIAPFNILIIGPTGSGKTELFRTLSRLLDIAFTKIDISGYTSSGYVGKNVDDIISIHLFEEAKKKAKEKIKKEESNRIYDRIYRMLANAYLREYSATERSHSITGSLFFNSNSEEIKENIEDLEKIYLKIKTGDEDILNKEVSIVKNIKQDIPLPPGIQLIGIDEPVKQVEFRDTIRNLIDKLFDIELEEIVSKNPKIHNLIKDYMENGIVFIDEIDKIAGKNNNRIDTTGVQKELLTLIEGKTVMTNIGPINTDKIMFICAGAFHTSKVSDLLPELLGRLPVRIVLKELTKEDYKRILVEPKYNMIAKIQKIYSVDGIKITFTDSAIEKIADYAYKLNKENENLGARRLHSILHMIIEDIDFLIEEEDINEIVIDDKFVENKLNEKIDYFNKNMKYATEDNETKKIGFVY